MQNNTENNNYQNDPVVRYAFDMVKQNKIYLGSDEISVKEDDKLDREVFQNISSDAWDIMNSFADIISATKATSLEGALIQSSILADKLQMMSDNIHDSDNGDSYRACIRLVHSIMSVLLESVKIDSKKLGVPIWICDTDNPWIAIKKAMSYRS